MFAIVETKTTNGADVRRRERGQKLYNLSDCGSHSMCRREWVSLDEIGGFCVERVSRLRREDGITVVNLAVCANKSDQALDGQFTLT